MGTVAVAQYSANPGGAPGFSSTGVYFDVYVPLDSTYTSVQITDCNLGGGSQAYWWYGSSWLLATNQSYDPSTGCLTITVNVTRTGPTISELSGTPFAISDQPPTLSLLGSFLAQQTVAANLQVSATDPEGDNDVTLSASGLPTGLALGATTCTGGVCSATISGAATAAVGSYSATITAAEQDASAASSKQTLTVYVDTNLSGYPTLSNGAYNLQNATLRNAYLVTINLAGANGTNATLSSANLSGANLSNANLTQANLSGANLSGANLTNATLSQANLKGATGLKTATLTGVSWSKTTCPDGTLSTNDGGTCLNHL
jgi:uncharacterized protein YjbI with pentapeptide repeats